LDGNLRFCENELKVSDIEGKMPWCWHPKAPQRYPFKNLEKDTDLLYVQVRFTIKCSLH